ncbi:30730_t:CDS:1, partial [Racocetra persica]
KSDLKDAIDQKPEESYWHCQLGALLYKQNDYNTSLKELDSAISLFQSSKGKSHSQKSKYQRTLMSETYHYRGLLYKAIGNLPMSNSDFKEESEL